MAGIRSSWPTLAHRDQPAQIDLDQQKCRGFVLALRTCVCQFRESRHEDRPDFRPALRHSPRHGANAGRLDLAQSAAAGQRPARFDLCQWTMGNDGRQGIDRVQRRFRVGRPNLGRHRQPRRHRLRRRALGGRGGKRPDTGFRRRPQLARHYGFPGRQFRQAALQQQHIRAGQRVCRQRHGSIYIGRRLELDPGSKPGDLRQCRRRAGVRRQLLPLLQRLLLGDDFCFRQWGHLGQ
jgi:hypothetical protein